MAALTLSKTLFLQTSSLLHTRNYRLKQPSYISISASSRFFHCRAAKQQQSGSVKKRRTQPKKKSVTVSDEGSDSPDTSSSKVFKSRQPDSLPRPPAGFVVDSQGKVLMASSKRIVTIVDPTNNLPLDCVIRRVFKTSRGDDCMLLCPADMPVILLKGTHIEELSPVPDEEFDGLLPALAFALAKFHMHLVSSGFCYTARGGFCYSEADILELESDDGQQIDGIPSEGVKIGCFYQDGTNYLIYTPTDPLMFVAVKDENGQLQIADDDLLEDPSIVDVIDEETEFNALVFLIFQEEEHALLESLFGDE